jgi:hypothetical protein
MVARLFVRVATCYRTALGFIAYFLFRARSRDTDRATTQVESNPYPAGRRACVFTEGSTETRILRSSTVTCRFRSDPPTPRRKCDIARCGPGFYTLQVVPKFDTQSCMLPSVASTHHQFTISHDTLVPRDAQTAAPVPARVARDVLALKRPARLLLRDPLL